MLLSNVEYIALRLARRFLFRDEFLLRFGRLIPHYRVNRNQADPRPLVADYSRHLADRGFSAAGRRILEVGTGATDSTGYEFAAQFQPAEMLMLEPFVAFAADEDQRLLESIATRHGLAAPRLKSSVRHLHRFSDIPDRSVDLIVSSSVLEHVGDPPALFRECGRVLRPGGAMLHLVDYRDHFFKYPYHFLQFSQRTWNRWLNPGDLPRWRVYDHLQALTAAGFQPTLLRADRDDAAFARIAPHLSADFQANDPLLPVSYAVIWAGRPAA
jgi:SAM-dependent methyltransferase